METNGINNITQYNHYLCMCKKILSWDFFQLIFWVFFFFFIKNLICFMINCALSYQAPLDLRQKQTVWLAETTECPVPQLTFLIR